MRPYRDDDLVTLYHGDCIEVMRSLPDSSVDAVVTDPPYGLGFMGKAWDDLPPGLDFAVEALRVLKPGGHLLAFGGTRTWHRLAVAVEDAGFEIRDSIAWLYGSGFPKSLDVSKAIDKAAGAEREVIGRRVYPDGIERKPKTRRSKHAGWMRPWMEEDPDRDERVTAPATAEAVRWGGWGTALKPAFEPVVVARKPLVSTVAANVLAYGTGALNIDGARIAHGSDVDLASVQRQSAVSDIYVGGAKPGDVVQMYKPGGRWPANVVLDESQAEELDRQSGYRQPGARPKSAGIKSTPGANGTMGGGWSGTDTPERIVLDGGGASRFFYVAKAPKRERPNVDGIAHPTVKPLALMRYLVRLVTPPGGVVLEPFAGSGTTIEAAVLEGFRCIAIEREADYLPLIEARLARITSEPDDTQQAFDLEGIA